ncbi:WD40 repeat domain-containing protein [Emticicia sp. BO119]|uniref:WD40 repeat domain-containing protein n=1 Tax=Emticicia sp. BO119 TaxID=2757768 RepID=UPI0015F0AC67|nr:WD40 repeat domain-containing protein [Emticicia sp. BO119]MBA4849835.1 WD40 repeat domain-containing protein [Emticicia sp. BO119]
MKNYFVPLFLFVSITSYSQNLSFEAKGIIAISDADMAASAFADGKLYKEKGAKDAFTTFKLPLQKSYDDSKSVIVSNSSANHTKAMVVSNTHHLAYVVDTRGMVADNVSELKNLSEDLPAGGFITVIDIANIAHPKVLYKFPTGKNPIGIDISPKGEYLVLCTEEEGKELQVLELDPTGKPIRIIHRPQNLPAGKISDVSWHPNDNYIAFTFEETKEIGLLKTTRDGPTNKIIRLELQGKPIKIGTSPGSGQFTSDGKFYIVSDLKRNEEGADGEIFVIRFSLDGSSEHFPLSRIKVGQNPEGFAISPDGRLIAVANIKKTYLPWENTGLNNKASLSLLKLTPDGSLNSLGEYEFEGILPKSLSFDQSGKNLAVSVYDYFNYGKHFGGIEFWKVTQGDNPGLQKQEIKLFLPRGCHSIRIIK